MQNIHLHPVFFLSLILIAAWATPDAIPITRGASCDKTGGIAPKKNTLFVCDEAPTSTAGLPWLMPCQISTFKIGNDLVGYVGINVNGDEPFRFWHHPAKSASA